MERRLEPYQILSLQDSRWMDFIRNNPNANIFHHPAWSQCLSACYGYHPFILAIINQPDKITAGIPLMRVKNILSGDRLVSLPFTDHCMPLLSNDTSDAFMQAAKSLYATSPKKRLELRWHADMPGSIQKEPTLILHCLELDPNPTQIFNHFNPAHRRNIRTALKSSLRVEWGVDENSLRDFYRLHLETRHRQGMPVQPWRFFRLLGHFLLEQGLGFVLLAYLDEECVASSIFLHWQKTLTYKFGASSEYGLPFRPNNLLMWTAIQWGCENGYATFDFGKTDLANAGLRRFKTGFGAREMPLVYTFLSAGPVNTLPASWLRFINYVIHHCPAWVCRAAGELLYRYAG